MSKHPGLKQYLANWTGDSEIRRDISLTIEAIAEACIEISALVARGPLAGELGAEKGDNEDGDTQKALDLIANDLLIEALHAAPVSCLVSEELKDPCPIKLGAPLFVATDPWMVPRILIRMSQWVLFFQFCHQASMRTAKTSTICAACCNPELPNWQRVT